MTYDPRFAQGKPLTLRIRHKDGSVVETTVIHSYSEAQIDWFKAGSALNLIAAGHKA